MKGAKIEGFSKCCRLRVSFRVMCPICCCVRYARALSRQERNEFWWYMCNEEIQTIGMLKGGAETMHGLCSCVDSRHFFFKFMDIGKRDGCKSLRCGVCLCKEQSMLNR